MAVVNIEAEKTFLSIFAASYEKLVDRNTINILWREMENGQSPLLQQASIIEYSFHYPVDVEAYLEELIIKFDLLNKEELRTIDGHFKGYIITFLYYCTNILYNRVSERATVLASVLYLKMISTPDIGKIFFEVSMFTVQALSCVRVMKCATIPESSKVNLLRLIKRYCIHVKLEPMVLRRATNSIIAVLSLLSTEMFQDIEAVPQLACYAIKCFKEIVMQEGDQVRIKYAFDSIFRYLRSSVLENVQNVPATLNMILIIIRDVLQIELGENKMQHVIEIFCRSWGFEDFNQYAHTVVIMNSLRIEYYKEIIRIMGSFTQSKNHKHYQIHIMHLLYEILLNLPPFPVNKIEVLYTCAVRNVVLLFLDPDKQISDQAIETFTQMCSLEDNPIVKRIFIQFETTGRLVSINQEAIFLAFNKIIARRGGSPSKNRRLLLIFTMCFTHSTNVSTPTIKNAFVAICKDSTPQEFLTYLPILHELFIIAATRGIATVAEAVLRVIFNCAMHPDNSSASFVNHIFDSLIPPMIMNETNFYQKYYCNTLLTSNFEYEALFMKMQNKIGIMEVSNALVNIDFHIPCTAVLLCSLLDHHKFDEIISLAGYMLQSFDEMATFMSMGHICEAFGKILDNHLVTGDDYPLLDPIQSKIISALCQQVLVVSSIKPAFVLFKKIRSVLKLPEDDTHLNLLLSIASENAMRGLQQREYGDSNVFMYLNEICLLLKKLPADNVLQMFRSYMDDPAKIAVLTNYIPDIYVQLLTLFTTFAMMTIDLVPSALKYLLENLRNNEKVVRLSAFKLLFSLCQEVTHEFEEVTKFAYRQLVMGDPCFARFSVEVLEILIREDYIRLTSEDFFKFIYMLGCDDLHVFMAELLKKQFLLSNQNDIYGFFIPSIVYMNICSKLPKYPISTNFVHELDIIKLRINNPRRIVVFLFEKLPIHRKFSILVQVCKIFEDILCGQFKSEEGLFNALPHFLSLFKFMQTTALTDVPDKSYYQRMIQEIQTEIVAHDRTRETQRYYIEFENEIKNCTMVLLKLLFFENEEVTVRIQTPLFDTLLYWIEFVKNEIIYYIYEDHSIEYKPYFYKLVQYYKRNKDRIESSD